MSISQFTIRDCQRGEGGVLLVHEDCREGAQAEWVVGEGEVGQELPEGVGADWQRIDLLVALHNPQMQAAAD